MSIALRNSSFQTVAALLLLASPGSAANIMLDSPPALPTGLSAVDTTELTATRTELMAQLLSTREMVDRQALACGAVAADSPKVAECRTQAANVGLSVKSYRAALADFRSDRTAKSMNASVKTMNFDADEQKRVVSALNSLGFDGATGVTSAEIRHAWQDVLLRGADAAIALDAGRGNGPGVAGAGQQSFEDCAVFALANAANQPYAVVATRATRLIDEGRWRDEDERAHPQATIEQKGLLGGEVIMLAEVFGQVEVIPSSEFARTLIAGRPVMVNVVPQSGNVTAGHEVVLTRTFQHNGATWYELMDSNQGPQRRLYLSGRELDTILQENGVAFRPEKNTVPRLLR